MPRLSDTVRWCEIDDIVIVLDVERGEYLALDHRASRSFEALADGRAVDRDFVGQCESRGWLGRSSTGGRTPPPIRPGFWRFPRLLAARNIMQARRRLRRRGFADAYRWAESWRRERGPAISALTDDLASFVAAETWLPSSLGDRDCLPRSLALFAYLRSLGHDVRHVIGVARFPFDAHAWVEFEDKPLLEFRAVQALLPGARTPRGRTPIAVIGADG